MTDIVLQEQAIERGLARYFTGLPCKRGHISERSTKWRACLECQSAKHKEWLKGNPECVREYARKAYHKDVEASRAEMKRRKKANPAKFKRYAQADYRKHREKRIKTVRNYYENHRQRQIASMRRWSEKNPEKRRAIARKWARAHLNKILDWRANNLEKVRVYASLSKSRRRIRQKSAPGTFTKADIDRIYTQQRGLCAYCRAALRGKYHIDHIVCLAAGGSNWSSNLQLCCPPCNQRKNAMDPIEFAQSIGLLI